MGVPECDPDAVQLVDYDQYFSWQARNLKNSILAEMFQKFNLLNDTIILHAGLPPAESFPFLSLTANTPHTPTDPTSTAAPLQQADASPAQAPTMQISLTGQMMNDAQQYMFHAGHPPLLRWARDMAAMQHHAPNPIDCAMSSGAVDAITAAVSCLLDPGDYILCEEFTYPHAPQCTFIPRRLNMLPVAMDEQGMRPESLRHVLATTPPSPVTGRPPRVAYIIPAGQNPTGAIMTTERKREIYQICREYGIIILEDDAYYWLQYPQGGRVPEAEQPGLQLPASFISMDVDSRVLRIDTFAKLLGPGFRLGWITGAPKLVSKVGHSIQAGSCGPSSLSQVVVSQLLEGWGRAGFEAFIKQQQALYARRADAVCAAAQRHLKGLATWEDPRAGMFMWFRLTGLADVDERLVNQLVAQRVAIVPGKPFWADLAAQAAGAPCPYFRIAFSCVPEDKIDEAFSRLATAIRAAMADTSTGNAPAAPPLLTPLMSGSSVGDAETVSGSSVADADAVEGGVVEGFPLGTDADVEGMVSLQAPGEDSHEHILMLRGKLLETGVPVASYASSRCSILSAGHALSGGGKARSTRSEGSGTSSGPEEEIEIGV